MRPRTIPYYAPKRAVMLRVHLTIAAQWKVTRWEESVLYNFSHPLSHSIDRAQLRHAPVIPFSTVNTHCTVQFAHYCPTIHNTTILFIKVALQTGAT